MNARRYTSLYWLGCYLIVLVAIGVQLIWLPAPYISTTGKQWIEVINQLYYIILSIPLCWLIGSGCRLWTMKQLSIWHKIVQAIIALSSAVFILYLILKSTNYVAILLLCCLVIVTLISDVTMSIRIERQLKRERKQHTHHRQLQWFILYIACIALVLCPTMYNVTYPAMTLNMNRYAHIGDHSAKGTIDGVLVFERPAFPIDFIYAKLFPEYELNRKLPGEPSIIETYSEVVTMKEDTNKLAAAVALREAGVEDSIRFDGVVIMGIVANSPADGLLQAGDIITSINNTTIEKLDDLLMHMNEKVKAGDEIALQVKRADEIVPVNITTAIAGDGSQRAVMGISIQTAYSIFVNESLQFQSYIAHVGGPSHGAMLTLSFLDQLTAGDITNGLYVAGTGTIEADGTIGMVGGIAQKAYAVSRTAADVFFVPAAGADIARIAAPQLNVVPVYTMADIIRWLEEQAGVASSNFVHLPRFV